MNNNEFQTIGLYEHNSDSYKTIKKAYELGQNVVGIVHATGTGKSYNALQLAYDNKDKKIVYVVPSNGITEHIKKIIDDNPNLDMKRDFSNLEFRTYQSFISLDKEEIANIDCDLLILDEFHHVGAPVWGARINTMIETHPNVKIFGMTAYTVRDRGTSYERDMANSDTNELFSGRIESRYDLCDAMIEGVLPKPIYKSAYPNLIGLESKLEKRVQKLNATSREYQEYMAILSDVKRKINESSSIPSILRKNVKPNGKYIYFCPPYSEKGTNDIETIKKQAIEWFKQFVPEKDIIIYTSTSDMGEDGKLNRDAFYDDVTLDGEKVNNKLRVMFAINQYNEGIHAPNIDGAIMGRGTTSDIVYFEQLGRALSVRGNTKEMFDELEKYSIEELFDMCKFREISVKESTTKEELIEKLIAPVVIDLTNNYEFIKGLENNLRKRIKDIQNNKLGNHRDIKINDALFDIEIENQDLFEMLRYVNDRLAMTWIDYYELAEAYYEHYGNLLIPSNFKTNDGYTYDENGNINLGSWLSTQRNIFSLLSPEKQQLLQKIGFVLNTFNENWQKKYELAKTYYKHYGNLNVPQEFKTINGFEYDESGINLYNWIAVQKGNFEKMSTERQQILKQIGFVANTFDVQWQTMYELAKKYYEHCGNSSIVRTFKTINGYDYDEKGVKLGNWIAAQRGRYDSLSDDRKEKLSKINFIVHVNDYQWNKYYELAKKYYEHYGDLLIPSNFKTVNGYEKNTSGVDLGSWLSQQNVRYDKLTDDRKQKLKEIGYVTNRLDNKWEKMYNLAKGYYEHYGNLNVPRRFKTINGYDYDDLGINLCNWITIQRGRYDSLSNDRKEKLLKINFIVHVNDYQWNKYYELAKKYYEHYGDLLIPSNFKTVNGYEKNTSGVDLGSWLSQQNVRYDKLTDDRKQKLKEIGYVTSRLDSKWEKMYNLAKVYYEYFGNSEIDFRFKTVNGYDEDKNGVCLGQWLRLQKINFDRLGEEKKQKLLDIKIKLGSKEAFISTSWIKMFEIAKRFYIEHNHLLVPRKYITIDGVKLGNWIVNQRNLTSPDSEKGHLLSSIGMIWRKKQNKENLTYMCTVYNIDQVKNKLILNHISMQEFQSKIEFLKANNMPITDENGLLNDIFSISSPDMKEKYGISLDEIINEYYNKNQIKKGV